MSDIRLPKLPARDTRPLYGQIMHILEQEIRAGRLCPGDQLPTQEALAAHFGVSLAPVKQALKELEERGIIATRQGRGTYVLDATPLSEEVIAANRIPHFTRDVAESGEVPSSVVLRLQVVPASAVPQAALQLGLPQDAQVLCVERVRLADDKPLCVQTGYFPEQLVPGLLERGLTGDESLTEVLQAEFGISVAASRQIISATAAGASEAGHLGVAVGAPLLLVERTSYLSTNEPFEFVVDRRLPDFNFVVWLRRQ